MRNMSFMLTTKQFENRTKTITRRLGWKFLKAGDLLMACKKCQGLKKGEKVVKLGIIKIVSTQWEPIDVITQNDVIREGFSSMTPAEFVTFFCKYNHCSPRTSVNRIEFEYYSNQKELL